MPSFEGEKRRERARWIEQRVVVMPLIIFVRNDSTLSFWKLSYVYLSHLRFPFHNETAVICEANERFKEILFVSVCAECNDRRCVCGRL